MWQRMMGFSFFQSAVVVTSTGLKVLLLANLAIISSQAAAPRLDTPIISGNRNVQITVRGDAGTEYSVEWSIDLTSWLPVGTGVAANGAVTLNHDASAYSTIFYRAKTAGGADGLAIFPQTLSLNVGSEGTLFPLATTNAVEWSSSAPGIATVDTNGVVSAVGKGTATVTATAGGQTASSIVTVYNSTGPNAHAYSVDLIAAARATNGITAEQELIYRTYAAFDESRLPAQFRGAPTPAADHRILSEISRQIDSLSPGAQELLRPFILPPIYEESWFAQQLSFAAPGGRGGSVITNANCNATFLPDQFYFRRTTTHFNIFARKLGVDFVDRGSERLIDIVASVIEQIYVAETTLLQRTPLSDANEGCNGGNGLIDIYIVHSGGPFPYGVTVAYGSGCVTRPSFIVVNRGAPHLHRAIEDGTPGDVAKVVKAILAHEFMHVLQFSMDRNADCKDMEWFDEATAEWAMDFVDSTANFEDGFFKEDERVKRAGSFLAEYLRTDHTASIENAGPSETPKFNGYADYLFFQFLARKFGSGIIKEIYDASAGTGAKRSIESIAAGLASRGGFKEVWPEFAVTLWNDPAESSLNYWKQQDEYDVGLKYVYSPEGARIRSKGGPTLETIEVDQKGAPSARFKLLQNAVNFDFDSNSSDYEIKPRSLYYDHLKFSDPTVHSAAFINPIASLPESYRQFIKVQVFTKIGGEWKGPLDWTTEYVKQFCLDKNEERLEEMIVIVSNSEANRGSEKPFSFPLEFPMQVSTSNVGCWQWEGNSTTETTGYDGTVRKSTGADILFEMLWSNPGRIAFETTRGTATGSQVTPLGQCTITSGGALADITKHAIPDGRLEYNLDLHLGANDEPNRDLVAASGSTELFTTTTFRCPDFTQTTSDKQFWGWLEHSDIANLTVSADGQTIEGNLTETSPVGTRKTTFKFTAKRQQ
jgi:hypothetical protein